MSGGSDSDSTRHISTMSVAADSVQETDKAMVFFGTEVGAEQEHREAFCARRVD